MIKKRLLVYLVMIGSLMLSIKLVKDIYRLWHADDRLTEAREELALAEKEQVALKQQLEEVDKGEWKERQIRDTLKMARPEEVVVVVPEEVEKLAETKEKEEELKIEGEKENWEKWWEVFKD